MTKRVDMAGQRFGRLAVKRYLRTTPKGNTVWLCHCDCGNWVEKTRPALLRSVCPSCGCYRRETSLRRSEANPAFQHQKGNPSAWYLVNGLNLTASMVKRRNNQSGVTGVSFDRTSGKWVARMMIRGRLVLNRMFTNETEAIAARRQAERDFLAPQLHEALSDRKRDLRLYEYLEHLARSDVEAALRLREQLGLDQ